MVRCTPLLALVLALGACSSEPQRQTFTPQPGACGRDGQVCCPPSENLGGTAASCYRPLRCLSGLRGDQPICARACPALECEGACRDPRIDAANCGACGHACRRGEACRAGRCEPPCEPWSVCVRHDDQGEFVTCDGACGCNGCSSGSFCDGQRCVRIPPCAGLMCDGNCIPRSDVNNCGGCGIRCGEGQWCYDSTCRQVSCPPGQRVCGERCVDTMTDGGHCGACWHWCDDRCEGGECRCTAPRVRCGSECVDTTTSGWNCGACGRSCYAGFVCVGGACQCPEGQTLCSNACRDLQTNVAHCGACDSPCVRGASCEGGRCACPEGQTVCAGAASSQCADLRSNSQHCGACGSACASGQVCASGRCGDACDPGLTLCAGAGCRDLTREPNHCGACGAACPASSAGATGGCASGRCACEPGRFDCNASRGDGCESTVPCA